MNTKSQGIHPRGSLPWNKKYPLKNPERKKAGVQKDRKNGMNIKSHDIDL